MKITFDVALDGSGWPGPLGESDFVFGEAWVGPLGLLGLLETRLGLGGKFDGELQRACRLAAALRDASGYWRPSFDVDPLGTCRRLLRDRDQLLMWGWRGEAVSSRLAALHLATESASPGVPDRLRAIDRALGVRSSGIAQLVTFTPLANLPPAWTAVFNSLQRSGVTTEERQPATTEALGDLAAARTMKYRPAGDGRLCLLRRHGLLDLADEIAASLAASEDLAGTVIIGADSVLEQALVRHGLPRIGANAAPTASSRLLPLVVEAAFHPMEMDDLHALLTTDPGPIPRPVGAALIDALHRCPGRRTAEWEAALALGLARVDDSLRGGIERRAADLLMPVCGRDEKLSLLALRARLETLSDWARGRAAHVPSLVELIGQIKTLLEAVELVGGLTFSRHELRRLCDDLGEVTWSHRPSQVGLAHVVRPGAILGPARAIVWWNFSRDTAQRPERLLLTRAEQEQLRAVGAEPPNPALAMAIEEQSWRRPLMQAQQVLVLACAHTDGNGDTNHPHPLWDDLTASLGEFGDARKLTYDHLVHLAPARTVMTPPRPLVAMLATTTVAAPLALRDEESPSSIERLLGCSMSWALHYHAHLDAGLAAGLPQPGSRLFGALAHRFLAQVLARQALDPPTAAALAETLFDRQCADICEALALPQHQASRATLRRAIVESARELVRLAAHHGVRTMATEVPGTMSALGRTIAGRLDLVWEEPAVVLDLKWGKKANVDAIESGTAIQLAAYAAMSEVDGRRPETGYFVLLTQEFLAEPGGRLAADAAVQGAYPSSQVWSAALSSIGRRRDELATGRLEAPGATGDEIAPAFAPTALRLAPPCKYCGFGALCGRTGAL